MNMTCFECGAKGEELHGYVVCEECRKKLRLFTDDIISKHLSLYESDTYDSYEEEIRDRLRILESEYVKKKIKLLHVLERLEHVS